jgi:3-oxoacyl-[acyl-carrier-protein] synthase-1
MEGALGRAGLKPADISYINLHGTGTQNNDIAEGTAIRRLFDPLYPHMSSTKSFTGHTLGASGAWKQSSRYWLSASGRSFQTFACTRR